MYISNLCYFKQVVKSTKNKLFMFLSYFFIALSFYFIFSPYFPIFQGCASALPCINLATPMELRAFEIFDNLHPFVVSVDLSASILNVSNIFRPKNQKCVHAC